ncbi:MAG: zinc ribbon domain-containing protein [Bacteroidales bacterium]|nr:zinc ribbon domain-containing protein [Bacteroidales bacterium]
MKCNKCNTNNADNARFCQQCGAPLPPKVTQSIPGTNAKADKKSSILITCWAGALLLIEMMNLIFRFLFERVVGNYKISIIVGAIIALMFVVINYLPIFGIKNKTLKIIGFILITIVLLISLITQIIQIVQAFSYWY